MPATNRIVSPGFAAATAAEIMPLPGCTQIVCSGVACAGAAFTATTVLAAPNTSAALDRIFILDPPGCLTQPQPPLQPGSAPSSHSHRDRVNAKPAEKLRRAASTNAARTVVVTRDARR